MPLVFWFNFYRFKSIYPSNSSGRINQLFCIFKGNPITWIYLESCKWRKLINLNGLLNAECLIFWGNCARNNFISSIRLRSCCYWLARQGGIVAVTINNPTRNNWAVQLFVNPNYPFIGVGWQHLNECMVWETLIRTRVANFGCLVIINPWVFFDVDNRKIPITVAVFRNKRFAKRRVFGSPLGNFSHGS